MTTIQLTEERCGDISASEATVHLAISGGKLWFGRAALQEAKEVRRLVETLRELGIGEDDIQLRNIFAETSKGLFSASSATYRISVRCEDLTRLSGLFDLVTDTKSCQLQRVEWGYSVGRELKNRLLAECLVDAEEKARQVAAAAGLRIDRIEQIREIASPPETSPKTTLESALTAASARGQTIADQLDGLELTPSQKVSVRVDITFNAVPYVDT